MLKSPGKRAHCSKKLRFQISLSIVGSQVIQNLTRYDSGRFITHSASHRLAVSTEQTIAYVTVAGGVRNPQTVSVLI